MSPKEKSEGLAGCGVLLFALGALVFGIWLNGWLGLAIWMMCMGGAFFLPEVLKRPTHKPPYKDEP